MMTAIMRCSQQDVPYEKGFSGDSERGLGARGLKIVAAEILKRCIVTSPLSLTDQSQSHFSHFKLPN